MNMFFVQIEILEILKKYYLLLTGTLKIQLDKHTDVI